MLVADCKTYQGGLLGPPYRGRGETVANGRRSLQHHSTTPLLHHSVPLPVTLKPQIR
jgi:hypothetical protein